jgi:hypothetical protein
MVFGCRFARSNQMEIATAHELVSRRTIPSRSLTCFSSGLRPPAIVASFSAHRFRVPASRVYSASIPLTTWPVALLLHWLRLSFSAACLTLNRLRRSELIRLTTAQSLQNQRLHRHSRSLVFPVYSSITSVDCEVAVPGQ